MQEIAVHPFDAFTFNKPTHCGHRPQSFPTTALANDRGVPVASTTTQARPYRAFMCSRMRPAAMSGSAQNEPGLPDRLNAVIVFRWGSQNFGGAALTTWGFEKIGSSSVNVCVRYRHNRSVAQLVVHCGQGPTPDRALHRCVASCMAGRGAASPRLPDFRVR